MAERTKGDCYICGVNLGKTAMKRHLEQFHGGHAGGEKCCLLKIEGEYKDYWLYIDVPEEKTLSDVDKFLRKIWLECCGHMSEFTPGGFGGKIGKNRKLNSFSVGESFAHLYDFGTTTESIITVAGNTVRPPQKSAVRLLARNTPPVFQCADCGKDAHYLCEDYSGEVDNQFYCTDCVQKYSDDDHILFPVTNSPRMGLCGYDGELDCFEFQPEKIAKGNIKQ